MKSLVADKGTLYRVLIGRFENRQQAAKMAALIKARENVAPVIYSE